MDSTSDTPVFSRAFAVAGILARLAKLTAEKPVVKWNDPVNKEGHFD